MAVLLSICIFTNASTNTFSSEKSLNWYNEGEQEGALFGVSGASAGDVNNDGYDDFIIGAYSYDNGQQNEGRAFLYYGSSSGLSSSWNWSQESNQEGALYANSVSSAGDVNNDGYDDVIVGAVYYDDGQSDEGRIYLYHGSSMGLSTSPSASLTSNVTFASFGRSVAEAGDVNGDGYDDVIVGSYQYSNGQTSEGLAFVFNGSASTIESSPSWYSESNQSFAYFGCAVAGAGDVNGDGYDDVIVGAYSYDNGQSDEGRVFAYYGSSSGLSSSANWSAEGNQESAYFGCTISSAGDVNGDGYDDVIIGAYCYDNGQTDEGRAYVYYGSSSGLQSSPAKTYEANSIYAYLGMAVSTAGDVNNDGYDDIIIGAYNYDNGDSTEGRAWIYLGSSSGLSSTAYWIGKGHQMDDLYGWFGTTAGDVNNDGLDDIVVGAPYFDNPLDREGAAYGYYDLTTGVSEILVKKSNDFDLNITYRFNEISFCFENSANSISVFDVSGKRVYYKNNLSAGKKIERFTQLPVGVYILKLTDGAKIFNSKILLIN